MTLNSSGSVLFTGDAKGWVCGWDVKDAGISEDSSKNRMYNLFSFRAHLSVITGIDYIEKKQIVMTARC